MEPASGLFYYVVYPRFTLDMGLKLNKYDAKKKFLGLHIVNESLFVIIYDTA